MGFRGDYQVKLYNADGTELALLDMRRIQSLVYERRINDIGTLSMTLDASDALAESFGAVDVIADVYRRNREGQGFALEDSFFMRYWNRFEDENGDEYLIFSGPHINHLLKRRIIIPDDDPNEAGGFSSKFAAADTVMVEFVNEQGINPASNAYRALPGLTAQVAAGIGINVFQRRQYEPLFDAISECGVKSEVYDAGYVRIDFRIDHNTSSPGNFVFRAEQIGIDRTKRTHYPNSGYLVFTPIRANMSTPSLTIDRKDEETFAWVGGQGIAEERIVFPVIANATSDSPWNVIEVYVDARSSDDTDGLLSAGLEQLSASKMKFDFIFSPDLDGFQGRYNVDWNLGDFVTASYANYDQDVRIMAVSINVSEDEVISVTLENQLQ